MLIIGFWKKQSGNMLSHKQGLNVDQIAALKEIKPGDRLVLWANTKDSETAPTYTLKVFKPKLEVE